MKIVFLVFFNFFNPRIRLCIFNGFIMDKILGSRLSAILLAGLMFIGQLIFALGAYEDKVVIMQIGRFVFG